MKTNEKRELSYFQSLLGKYISEHHPELSNDKAFLSSRADEALNVYANAITIGLSDLEAEEAANEVLYNGLHFSKYDTIVEVLWNEFAEPLFKCKGNFRLSIGKDSQRLWEKSPPEGCIYPIVLAFSEIRPL